MAFILRRKGGGGGGGRGRGGSTGRPGGGSSAPHSVTKHAGVSLPKSSGSNIKVSTKSNGGGKSYKLPKLSPFAGRRAGGGKRAGIYGTSRYGSGYPDGVSGSVAGRPTVYVFWPVPIQEGYYGGDEYARKQTERPGGNITVATIKSNSSAIQDTYRIIGDALSVVTVYDALSAKCGILNTQPYITNFTGFNDTAFNTTNNASLPKPEQIIQWYRASTFGLALDGYNNTAALRVNMPVSNTSAFPAVPSTPLPHTLNAAFLLCLNSTIAASLPLVVVHHGMSHGELAGIIVGSIIAGLLVI